ncbi:MAG: efflux RND transporter periplasmic adaptor subunit, partial [Planctomycetota bacterium]
TDGPLTNALSTNQSALPTPAELSSQSPPRPQTSARRWVPLLTVSILACSILAIVWATAGSGVFSNAPSIADVPLATARVITLRDTIKERGNLESQQAIEGVCKMEGYEHKVIFIVPDGSLVEKDQVVVRLDTSELVKEIEEQEVDVNEAQLEVDDAMQQLTVQQNENISSIRQAQQEYDFAQLDLNMYLEGDYRVNLSDIQGAISEAQTEVDRARRAEESMRNLVNRGLRRYEQLREAEQVLMSAELRLRRDQLKLDKLENHEHPKNLKEFESKLVEAEHKLNTAKDTAEAKEAQAREKLKREERRLEYEERRLERLQENLARSEMTAPAAGTLAYARNRWRGEEIREGGTVHEDQTVFTLPNMRLMQVEVGVHESLVSKVKAGMPAAIRIDSYSSIPFTGRVEKIAPLADHNWSAATRTYETTVTIDSIPDDVSLKPGMTAQVEIIVGEYPDVLAVPVQAIAAHKDGKYVYVLSGNGFERLEVTTGRDNISFVEIIDGLEDGEQVALDAYQRAIEDFADADPLSDSIDSELAEAASELSSGLIETDGEDDEENTGSDISDSGDEETATPGGSNPDESNPIAAEDEPETDIEDSSGEGEAPEADAADSSGGAGIEEDGTLQPADENAVEDRESASGETSLDAGNDAPSETADDIFEDD